MAVLKYKDPTTGNFVELLTGSTEIIDNLDSTSKTSALSANQGRVLNEKIPTKTSQLTNDSNYLNDKRLLLELIPDATGIDAEADLNTIKYLNVGKFVITTDAGVLKLKNCPARKAFTMWVFSPLHDIVDRESTGTWQYRVREIRTYEGDIYIQSAYVTDKVGNWQYSSWKKMASTNDNVASSNTSTKASLADKLECINGRITNANIAHSYENNKAHLQLLLATAAMTSNKPAADGYILHCSWDNGSQWNGQLYMPNSNANVPLQFRGDANGNWGGWENIYRCKTLYNNDSGTNGTITLSETAANFAYFEIFFSKSEGNNLYRNSVKVYSPNGKIVDLIIAYNIGNAGLAQLQPKCISISGTAVSNTSNTTGYANLYNGRSVEWGNSNEIKIHRILGYR